MQIQEKIDKLQAEILRLNKDIVQLKRIVEKFPDAFISQDRWKNERVFSKIASPLCDKYDWRHSCGCCADSSVQVWPYLETEFGKVFAAEAPLYVMDRDEYGMGTYLRNGFDVSKTNLSDGMKRQIQEFIDLFATGEVKSE
jgi:hypothetical protein